MRALITLFLCAVSIFSCLPLTAKAALKDKTTTKEAIESLLQGAQHKEARGAKEIFVYAPKPHKSNGPDHIGSLPPEEITPTKPEPKDTATIRPNFENAELENLINFVAQLTQINVIPTKDTQGVKVSLNMRSNLTTKEVWEVFLTVIEMAGFTINRAGNVYKVLRQDAKKTEPLPAYINVPASTLPDTDASVRFVTFLRNIQASDVESLLRGMLGQGGDVTRQDNVNAFIITDKCNNIKSAMTILNELDNAELREVVSVIPLKKTDATEVKKLLDDMTKNVGDKSNNAIVARLLGKTQESSEYFSASTKIIVEDRSNSLILMGNQKSIKKVEDFIEKYIEGDLQGEVESPIHRYQLEYSDAREMKELLDAIVNTQTDSGAERFGGVRKGGKYFKKMRFEVDKDNNALLVSCSDKSDWKMLKRTIKDLDKPKTQVAIETLIVDIDLDNQKGLGSQIRSPRADQPFPNIGWQSAAIGPVVLGGSVGATNLFGNFGSMLTSLAQGTTAVALSKSVGGIWGIFNVLNTNSNASLVDNSFITVANRVSASLTVGESRRVVSQVYAGNSSNTNSYETKKAGTSYSYTPQVNPDGLINLNVNITMKSFLTDNATTDKSFKSTLACADGQVLVLGGFVKTKATESQNDGMPLLSQIPLIGWLFKNKSRRVTKTYTFFFICPTILKTRTKPGVDMYTRMKLHRARKEVEASVLTSSIMDPVHNIFFNGSKENYHHKIDDFANARFQPSTIDIKHDPFYNPGIVDQNPQDFADEYASNNVVQKMVAAQAASEGKGKPETLTTTKVLKNPEQRDSKEIAPSPEAQKMRITLTDRTAEKEPEVSTEKRAKLKEILSSREIESDEDNFTTSHSLDDQRSAFKKMLSGSPSGPATSGNPQPVPPSKKHSITYDHVAQLIKQQEDKRSQLKDMLSIGDKKAVPYTNDATSKRKNLKELLASYSTKPQPQQEALNQNTSHPVSVKES